MQKTSVVNQNSYSKQIYFSRFKFLIDHYNPGKILDIGNIGGICGEGNSVSMHHKLKNSVKKSSVYGFDLCKPKDSKAFTNQKQGNIEIGLPYKDNYFETVYMGSLIEHLSNFDKTLSEIHRVLKKNGKFILDTPNAYSFINISRWIIKRKETLHHPDHLIFFTPASITALLKKHNFKIETLSEKFTKLSKIFPHLLIKGMGDKLLISATK